MREENRDAMARQEAASRAELMAIREAYQTQIEALRSQLARQSEVLAETSKMQFENLSNAALSDQQEKIREIHSVF